MHRFRRCESPIDWRGIEKECRQTGEEPWAYFVKKHHQMHIQIRDCLYDMQSHCCAYCDCQLPHPNTPGIAHIEHLERRSDNPCRIFDWSNMFLSCNHIDSCGFFKDSSKPKIQFDIHDIVDPSQEDPQDFFQYDPLGTISPRRDVSQDSQHRAKETIRVFNLNAPRLCNIRQEIAITVSQFQESQEDAIEFLLENVFNFNCPSVYFTLLGRRMP